MGRDFQKTVQSNICIEVTLCSPAIWREEEGSSTSSSCSHGRYLPPCSLSRRRDLQINLEELVSFQQQESEKDPKPDSDRNKYPVEETCSTIAVIENLIEATAKLLHQAETD